MKYRQYRTECIVVVSIRSISPHFTAAMRSDPLNESSDELFDGNNFTVHPFPNLCDVSSTFTTRSYLERRSRYDLLAGGSSSVSINCSMRIICTRRSSSDSIFCETCFSKSYRCSAYQCLSVFRIEDCMLSTNIALTVFSLQTDPHVNVSDQSCWANNVDDKDFC